MEANELQQRREALGMSRDALAKALHTTSVSVWRWENGERGIPAHLPLALETVERNQQGRPPKATAEDTTTTRTTKKATAKKEAKLK
jgi:transcriptional regulator with XRE-family HTH domain